MDFSVGQNSFWQTSSGTLSFTEKSPPEERCEHQVCNCTRAVAERPDGAPTSVKQWTAWNMVIGPYRGGLSVRDRRAEFCFRWPAKEGNPEGRKEDHAYFWFSPHRLQIEVTGTGGSNVDCSFGAVFFGNDVDISRFYNGHSPSGLVDITKLTPGSIWAHYCSGGQEAVAHMSNTDEAREWHKMYETAETLWTVVDAHFQPGFPVDVIRRNLLATDLGPRVVRCVTWLVAIIAIF